MKEIEQKKEKLKTIVSHIICETPTIYEVMKESISRLQKKFVVKINEDKNSRGSRSDGTIIFGVGNHEKLYSICKDFILLSHLEFRTENTILDFISDDNLCIDFWDLKDTTLNNIDLLNKSEEGPVDVLVKYAFAYTLYHEFGHVKYDDDSMFKIEKERTADNFALEVLRESCFQESNTQLEENPIFLGAFMENILILQVSKAKETENTMSHPHPIERIYLFLEYFHINNNSYLWRYAYDTIVKWINDNNLAMTFVKDSSISIKDKMLDAYHRFKK